MSNLTQGSYFLSLKNETGETSGIISFNHLVCIIIEDENQAVFVLNGSKHTTYIKNVKSFRKSLDQFSKELGESNISGLFLEINARLKLEDGFINKQMLIPKTLINNMEVSEVGHTNIFLTNNTKIETVEKIDEIFKKL